MEEEKARKLFECVKKDDVKSFGELQCSEVFSAVFDRFPILSLCYLYGAKRIVKTYLDPMLKAVDETQCGRIPEADERFSKAAGKAARYYLSGTVHPLEMLAILGETKKLKNLYEIYPRAEKHLNAINKIYFTRLGENVVVKGSELILPTEPMSFSERKRSEIAAAVLFSFGVLILCVAIFATMFFGTGSTANACKVRNEGELVAALNADVSVRLERTITLSYSIPESKAKIDGNGNTIRLRAPLFETFSGEISDLNFFLEKEYKGGGVIGKNEGKLYGVAVATDEITLEKVSEYQALLADENEGLIDSCYVMSQLSLGGTDGGNCYFGAVCGKNSGTINGCHSEGIMNAENADLAGIVGCNEKEGTVSDAFSKALLTETSSLKSWNPNVAGICVENQGTIFRAENTGKITAILSAPALEENDSNITVSYAAGVVCVNTGDVNQCTNKGEIVASASNGHAYAGGIVALNALDSMYNAVGVLEENVSEGKVTASSEGYNAYAAGVVCVNTGDVNQCRNKDEIVASASEGHAYAGGIVAANTFDSMYNTGGSLEENVSEGKVTASSENAYAGGIAAYNSQSCRISACRQSAEVRVESKSDDVYSFVGGIVGYNAGGVEKSIYTASVQTGTEVVSSGAICGLVYLRGGIWGDYSISLGSNAFLKKEGETPRVSGAIIAEYRYRMLVSNTIYTEYALEKQAKDEATEESIKTEIETYYLPLLDKGATAYEDIKKIKELDEYHE